MKKTCMIILFLTVSSAFAGAPVIERMRAFRDTVGRYEKFEVFFDVRPVYANPFDPEEVDIMADFTAPSGKKWNIPAFFNPGFTFWMVRFSPDETGQWTCRIRVKDQEGSAESEPVRFTVTESKHHGPVRISGKNNRYLEHADGTPFYGVGLWYNGGLMPRGRGPDPSGDLNRLKDLGVNYISTILSPLETVATGVGRYDQGIAMRLDRLVEWCEERDMIIALNLWFHSFLSETVWPGGNRRWHTNPYQFICRAKDFYSSKEAWKVQEKLYRYIIARWAYSRALGIWFVIDEVNGTDGWVSGDSLGAAKWGKKVHDFFKANDPYGHPTTGTRSGGIQEFWHEGYQIFDLAAREIYEAQGFPILTDGKIDPGDANPLRLSYTNYAREIGRLWKGYDKPSIIGETGWDHTFFEPSMPGYLAQVHNALWVSLGSGACMTPFWWSYSAFVNDNVVNRQLLSISRFVREIAFSDLTGLAPADAALSGGDAFAMKSDRLVFGWVVNPDADVSGRSVTVRALPAGDYRVRLYHTWGGRFFHEERIQAPDGISVFTIPVLKIEDSHAQYVGQDIAFILEPVE